MSLPVGDGSRGILKTKSITAPFKIIIVVIIIIVVNMVAVVVIVVVAAADVVVVIVVILLFLTTIYKRPKPLASDLKAIVVKILLVIEN